MIDTLPRLIRLRATMKKLVSLSLCLSLSLFAVARAVKPGPNPGCSCENPLEEANRTKS
jgi:hypothetical protein